jgi:hypothetical protein
MQTDAFSVVDSDESQPTVDVPIYGLPEWFYRISQLASEDLEFAVLLRERALQYDNRKFGRELRRVAESSLDYINVSIFEHIQFNERLYGCLLSSSVQRCGIPYKKHIHPAHTNECVICRQCCLTSDTEMSPGMAKSRNALRRPTISIMDRLAFKMRGHIKLPL